MIERVRRQNPKLTEVDFTSPLSVGNGDFAINVDVTGFQTLHEEFLVHHNPLCTLSNWAWHTTPDKNGKTYRYSDLVLDEYPYKERVVHLPVHAHKGNEEVYEWLRKNPHRANLAIFELRVDGEKITSKEIFDIEQMLELEQGIVRSEYTIKGEKYQVETFVDCESDTVFFKMKSVALQNGRAKILLRLPYPNHQISAGEFSEKSTQTAYIKGVEGNHRKQIQHMCDEFSTFLDFHSEKCVLTQTAKTVFEISTNEEVADFSVTFSKNAPSDFNEHTEEVKVRLKKFWHDFWTKGEIPTFDVTDEKMQELERRGILSMYQLRLHSSGKLPPQETGLLCNSWYGKFHLEMTLWHFAWAIETNRVALIKPQFSWFKSILPQAKWNAEKNGFKGARWPKMIGPDAIDSPSFIAPLLIWQQTHIVTLLDWSKEKIAESERLVFQKEFWVLVEETIDFVCDFLSYDEKEEKYCLVSPMIPSQEEFDPNTVYNPTFELAYWKYGISQALRWAEDLGEKKPLWQEVYQKIAIPQPTKEGLYPSHENAPDTFPNYMKDHPTQLAILGLFDNPDVEMTALEQTLSRVLKDWDEESMWGWDYGYMALLAEKLGNRTLALEILLKDCPKNYYAKNGHNYQRGRTDLPAYLPGNGSLVLAVSRIFTNTTT
ncbi:hypothetical protein SAMN02745116_00338 [Pilibacter termitis]|uniref:Glycosyl hydrolase family 65, N-terminal domain n=1 Tax=Pilibacter termitis TaxID=263852 RepID=A0A1T4KR15_9ENTE|nr:hypothetical protein [Pilibacter termitis]SJZ44823.1 hypothetical protein SAMN02745116_00338 [Pilibacter termitis]